MILATEPLLYLAGIKIILALSVISCAVLIWRRVHTPFPYLILATITYCAFLTLLLAPLKTMWWGNNGDEMYMAANFTHNLNGGFFTDHYHHFLPTFYPPLYFWITSIIAHPIATNGITTSKIGVLGATAILTIGTYLWMCLYRRLFKETNPILASSLFYFLIPISLLSLMDFDAFIFKPHETLSAMWAVLLAATLASSLHLPRWNFKQYAFFSLSGAAIFLTYYFWWVLLAPTLLILSLLNTPRFTALVRVVSIGLATLLLSLPYLYPFLKSALHLGIENFQGIYFSIEDITTFLPWKTLSFPTILLLAGAFGLMMLRRMPWIQGLLVLTGVSYFYQFLNLGVFIAGFHPLLPSKPFMYGVTALFSAGCAALITHLTTTYSEKISPTHHKTLLIAGTVLFFTLSPLIRFIDNPRIQKQFSQNFWQPDDYATAELIKEKIPDYTSRTWLMSADSLNSYLPLSHFIAHNAHYTNHLAHFSNRLAYVIDLTASETPETFFQKTQQANPPITALMLYYDKKLNNIPLIFWLDNFPNAGHEVRYNLSPSLLSSTYWTLISDTENRRIYIKK